MLKGSKTMATNNALNTLNKPKKDSLISVWIASISLSLYSFIYSFILSFTSLKSSIEIFVSLIFLLLKITSVGFVSNLKVKSTIDKLSTVKILSL